MVKDFEAIGTIKDAFIDSIKTMNKENPDIFADDRFGIWATSALFDLLCASAKQIGLGKEMVISTIDEIWDAFPVSNIVLN